MSASSRESSLWVSAAKEAAAASVTVFIAQTVARMQGPGGHEAQMRTQCALNAHSMRELERDHARDDQQHAGIPQQGTRDAIEEHADQEGARRADASPDRVGRAHGD